MLPVKNARWPKSSTSLQSLLPLQSKRWMGLPLKMGGIYQLRILDMLVFFLLSVFVINVIFFLYHPLSHSNVEVSEVVTVKS